MSRYSPVEKETAKEGKLTSASLPSVSLIVPCRNSVKTIEETLSSLFALDYPEELLEIIVVDGMSTDGTKELVENVQITAKKRVTLLENPRRITPCAFNIGIKHARGELVGIVNSHTRVAPSYLKEAAKILNATDSVAVGGPVRPVGRNYVSRVLTSALASWFGLGGAHGRRLAFEGYVDSIFMGVYRTETLKEVDCFDEHLVRGQDHELNCRICKTGGKIFMSPKMESYYYCRDSLRALVKQMFRTGVWGVKKIQRNPDAFAPRHWVPFGFVSTLILLALLSFFWTPLLFAACAILALYFAVNLSVSALLAARKELKYLPVLPAVFACMHFPYGFGTIVGLFRFGFPVSALLRGIYRWLARPRNAGIPGQHQGAGEIDESSENSPD